MWRLSLFLLIIGCVAIPREEQIREFCLDPANECVEAVREGETLRAEEEVIVVEDTERENNA